MSKGTNLSGISDYQFSVGVEVDVSSTQADRDRTQEKIEEIEEKLLTETDPDVIAELEAEKNILEANRDELDERLADGNAPTANTLAATNVSHKSATLNCTLNAGGTKMFASFAFGLPSGSKRNVGEFLDFRDWARERSVGVTGLDPETTYEFEIIARNAVGAAEGGIVEFTTEASP